MRHQSKWTGKVKTSLQVKEYPMRLQWGYYMSWGKPVFLPVCQVGAMTGAFDSWIKRAARMSGLRDLQYDELAVFREHIGRYIGRYDSRKGCLEGYLFKLARWAVRGVYARQHNSIVHYPYYLAERGIRVGQSVRIDALLEQSIGNGDAGVRANLELEEIRRASDKSTSPDHVVLQREIRQAILEALEGLSEKEREIVEARVWQLMGHRAEHEDDRDTLEEIGAVHGVCRERVRRIQGKALGKLRKKLAPVWREYVGG